MAQQTLRDGFDREDTIASTLRLWASQINTMLTELYGGGGGGGGGGGSITYTADPTSATLDRTTRNGTGSYNAGQNATVVNAQKLWPAQVGDTFTATKTNPTAGNGAYRVDPDDAGAIGPAGTGKYLEIIDVGTTVKFRCLVANKWQLESASGAFSYEP